MARGRFLSDSVAKDAKLNAMTTDATLVYLMVIPHLDRDGLIDGDPEVLFGTVCPKRRAFIDRMDEFIAEWKDAGLVEQYNCDNGPVLWFKGFSKNQVGLRYEREAPSRFPLPPSLFQDAPPVAESIRQPSGGKSDNGPKGSGGIRHPEAATPRHSRTQPTPANVIASAEPATRSVTLKSPHLDARRFVDGYIPQGTAQNAVEVYYERFSINHDAARLNAIKEDDLARGCPDLARLREVMIAYSRTTFKPGNIQLILDWYGNGVPDARQSSAAKSNGRSTGKSDRNMAVIDEFERAYGDVEIVPAFINVGGIHQ